MQDALSRVVQEAQKIKKQVAAQNVQQAEDPEVVRAREAELSRKVYREWLDKQLRECPRLRTMHIALPKAGITDEHVKLLSRGLQTMVAEMTAEGVKMEGRKQDDSESEDSDTNASAHLERVLHHGETDSDIDPEEEGVTHLKNVRWPDDPREDEEGNELATSDSDSVRSFRFTPRDERVDWNPEMDLVHRHHRHQPEAAVAQPQVDKRASKWRLLEKFGAEKGTGCKHLDLMKNEISGKGVAYLCGWLKISALQVLLLSDNPFGDTGCALLGRSLKYATALTTLGLQRCGVTELGLRHLANGLGCATIAGAPSPMRKLWLMGNTARDEGAKHLARALRSEFCGLAELGLEGNRIGSAGGVALGRAIAAAPAVKNALDYGNLKPGRQCPLITLRLDNNPLGGEGVVAIARGLDSNSVMAAIHLRGCGAGDEGGLALAHALTHNNVSLSHLGVEDNRLTLLTTRALRAAMARCGLRSLALDLSQGGVFRRPMGPDDLEHAPPRTPPPKRSGQRRKEAHEEKLAEAKLKSFNDVMRGVGAMKEHDARKRAAAARERDKLMKLDKIRLGQLRPGKKKRSTGAA